MPVIHAVCCGIDVHAAQLTACLRQVSEAGQITTEVAEYGTTYAALVAFRSWLHERQRRPAEPPSLPRQRPPRVPTSARASSAHGCLQKRLAASRGAARRGLDRPFKRREAAVSRVPSRQGLGTVRLGKAGGRAPSNNSVWRAASPLNVGVTMQMRLNPDYVKGTCVKGAGSAWLVE